MEETKQGGVRNIEQVECLWNNIVDMPSFRYLHKFSRAYYTKRISRKKKMEAIKRF